MHMINVKVRENQISLTGHAGIAPAGSDVACAGVSALTLTLSGGFRKSPVWSSQEVRQRGTWSLNGSI